MYWARQVFLFLRALSTIIFARIVALMPAIYRQLNNIPPILESTIVSSQSRILYRSLGLLNLEPPVIIRGGGNTSACQFKRFAKTRSEIKVTTIDVLRSLDFQKKIYLYYLSITFNGS